MQYTSGGQMPRPPQGATNKQLGQAYGPNPFQDEMTKFQLGAKSRWKKGEGMSAFEVPLYNTAYRGIAAAQPGIRQTVPMMYGQINDLLAREGQLSPQRQGALTAFQGAQGPSATMASWAPAGGAMAPAHQQAWQQGMNQQAVQQRAQQQQAAQERFRADLARLFPMLSDPVSLAYGTGGNVRQAAQNKYEAEGDRKKQALAGVASLAANLFAPGSGALISSAANKSGG